MSGAFQLSEINRERLKRGLFLLIGGGIILLGVSWLAKEEVISSRSLPFSRERFQETGKNLLGKTLKVLGKKGGDQSEEEVVDKAGQVARVIKEGVEDPQAATEKVVEKKAKEIVEMIKRLPGEQAEAIRKQVMKEICEEVCRVEPE